MKTSYVITFTHYAAYDKWYNQQGFDFKKDFPEMYKYMVTYGYQSMALNGRTEQVRAWRTKNRIIIRKTFIYD